MKTSNKSTARYKNAPHCLGICSSCWFQQDGATVHTTIRARSWPKSRFGGSHQPPDQAPVAGQESGPVALDLVLERGHDRAQKKTPPPTTTLVELKETIGSFAQSIDDEVKQVVLVSADELAPAWSVTARRLRRDSSGPDSVVLCRPSPCFVC